MIYCTHQKENAKQLNKSKKQVISFAYKNETKKKKKKNERKKENLSLHRKMKKKMVNREKNLSNYILILTTNFLFYFIIKFLSYGRNFYFELYLCFQSRICQYLYEKKKY